MSDLWGPVIAAIVAVPAAISAVLIPHAWDRRERDAIRGELELAELLKGTKEGKQLVAVAKKRAGEYALREWVKEVRRFQRWVGIAGVASAWIFLVGALFVSETTLISPWWALVPGGFGVLSLVFGVRLLNTPREEVLKEAHRLPVFTDDPAPAPTPPSPARRRWLR